MNEKQIVINKLELFKELHPDIDLSLIEDSLYFLHKMDPDLKLEKIARLVNSFGNELHPAQLNRPEGVFYEKIKEIL